ncbi:MAG: caspase family protein [Pseudomonadota bacterium]
MANKALLVGINKYKIPGADLNGCLNDVANIRDILLKYFGFSTKEIRVLADDRATKANILKRFEWLVNSAKPGDRLVFHFSGHGSQVVDRDGDELKDKMDEIICPHDMDWDGIFITDDDLGGIFSGLAKGVNLEVFLDSCHSGTGTREIQGIKNLPVELSFMPRFLTPPMDIACRMDEDMEIKRLLKGGNPFKQALFAGCRDNQTSADAYINGGYNGAFTYYLCKHMRDVKGEVSREELLKRIRASLKYNGFSQVPQLECPKAERVKKVLE